MPERKPNMKTQRIKLIFSTIAMLALVVGGTTRAKAQEPLPSWNDGPAKQAILAFVKEGTHKPIPSTSRPRIASPPSIRTARYGSSTDVHASDVLPGARAGAGGKETGTKERRAVQDCPLRRPGGNRETPDADLEKIVAATLTGMSADEFRPK